MRRFLASLAGSLFLVAGVIRGVGATSLPADTTVVTGRFTQFDALLPEYQDGLTANSFTLTFEPTGTVSGSGGYRFQHESQYGNCTGPWIKTMDAQFDGTYAPATGQFSLTMTSTRFEQEPMEEGDECTVLTIAPADASGTSTIDGAISGEAVTFSWPGMAATAVTRGGSPAATVVPRGAGDGGTGGATVALVGGLVLLLLVLVLLGAPGGRDLLRRLIARARGGDRPTATPSPAFTRTAPDDAAERARLVLQPGNEYQEVCSQDGWVLVDDGHGNTGWVHRAALDRWQQETIVRPTGPTVTAAIEQVMFDEPFETRDPHGRTFTRHGPGQYRVGPRGADGCRPVYDFDGRLVGHVPADKVPPPVLDRQSR